MKICASYSQSHEVFLKKFFLDTVSLEEGMSLIIKKIPQKCASGSLFSEGWRDQMIEKEIFINDVLKRSDPNEIFLFCDVDLKFYGNIKKDLTTHLVGHDIVFMKDHNSDDTGRCGGFFALKSSQKMKVFFKKVLSRLRSYEGSAVSFETSEQSTINNLLKEQKGVSWGYLPERYYTHGLYTSGIKNFTQENQSGLWWENKSHDEKASVYVPSDLLVHHANWCNGLQNKVNLLGFVSDIHAYNCKSNKGRKK